MIDRFGKRAIIGTLAPMTLIVVHSLLGATDVDPVGPLVGQGLSYSGFAAVLWPSVPLVVQKQYIGLAYGVVTSVQNIGLASFPLIIATIYTDSDDQYIPNVEYFFVGLAVCGTLVGFYLNYYDHHHGHIFNSPSGRGVDSDGDEKNSSNSDRVSTEDADKVEIDFRSPVQAGAGRESAGRHSSSDRGRMSSTSREARYSTGGHDEGYRARLVSAEVQAAAHHVH